MTKRKAGDVKYPKNEATGLYEIPGTDRVGDQGFKTPQAAGKWMMMRKANHLAIGAKRPYLRRKPLKGRKAATARPPKIDIGARADAHENGVATLALACRIMALPSVLACPVDRLEQIFAGIIASRR